MIVTYVTSLLNLRSQLEKRCRYENFVLHELFYYKDAEVNEQFNTTFISLVIASLFQAFSFHNLTCNKRYAAFT